MTQEDLLARAAITDVIYRYCRGVDRIDRALTLSCWHPGGTIDLAPFFVGSVEDFFDRLEPAHRAMQLTIHTMSNIQIALRGDRAGAESYGGVLHRVARGDDVYDIFSQGRFIDEFESIGGVWALRHRKRIRDWSRVDKVAMMPDSFDPPLVKPNNPDAPKAHSARDKSDDSYRVLKP